VGLSSPGIGSSLDVNSIVSQLMTIEQQPLKVLATKEASYQAKLSGFGTLQGALSQFQTAVRGLSNTSTFQGVQVTAADASVVSASGTADATAGTHTLNISQRAKAQTLVAAGVVSDSTPIGTNTTSTLTFDFGTVDASGGSFNKITGLYTGATFTSNGAGVKTITIDSTNNSLSGIRDAINSANIGVTASIVNDGSVSPYRLELTNNATGQTNSMKISVSGDATLSTLLSQDPASNTGQALSETISAQNAKFTVDGIAISKTTNTATDVLKGVTLNLLTDSGSTNIVVAQNTSSVINGVTAFVNAYNNISRTLSDAMAYNPTTKAAAIFTGDATVRSIQTQMRSVLSAPVAGGASAFTVLSQVGVTFQKDGTLAVDNTKLQTAITNNFSGIAGLFATVGKATDSLATYSSATAKTIPGAYAVNVTQLAGQASTTGSAVVAAGPTQGFEIGAAAAGLTITAGINDALSLTVDGVSGSVVLTPGTYATAAALATEVQTRINAALVPQVTVSQAAGVITITSNGVGPSSAVNVTAGNGKTNLLGASPAITNGSQTSITAGVNDTLQVLLDGVTSTVTLSAGRYSYATLATEVQSKINGISAFSSAGSAVSVTQAAGVMKITSNRFGSGGSASVTSGNGLTNLLGAAPILTIGVDISGTINGVAGTGSGQALTGATGDPSEGLSLQITGGSIGARGTVNYSQGYANQFDQLITRLLDTTNGTISASTNGINASIKDLTAQSARINAQLTVTEARYRAQFTALDIIIASMKTTSDFLTQQLASLTKTTA